MGSELGRFPGHVRSVDRHAKAGCVGALRADVTLREIEADFSVASCAVKRPEPAKLAVKWSTWQLLMIAQPIAKPFVLDR